MFLHTRKKVFKKQELSLLNIIYLHKKSENVANEIASLHIDDESGRTGY